MSKRNKPAPQTEPPAEPDLIDRAFDELARIAGPAIVNEQLDKARAQLRQEFGGQRHYVKRVDTVERAQHHQRCAEILAQHFNGRNATELARKLRIGRATVYRLLKQPGRPK